MPIIHLEDGIPPSTSKIVSINATQVSAIAAGGNETSTLTPPKGHLWEVLDMYLNVGDGAGSAAGEQTFDVIVGTLVRIRGSSNFGSALKWAYAGWETADASKKPSDVVVALMSLQGLVVDNENPLKVKYWNNLDVQQAAGRAIYFTVRQIPII